MEQASEWAHKLAQQKSKQRDKIAAENAKTLSDRHLIESKASALWQLLRQDVQRYIEEVNKAMSGEQVLRFDASQSDRIAILDKLGRELYCFVFHGDQMVTPDETYKLEVIGTSNVVWKGEKVGNCASDTIASVAVERAFRDTP